MNWELVCLIVIAVTSVVMATIQVAVLIQTAKYAKQAAAAAEQIRRDVQSLIAKAHQIADEAKQATSLALAQVERVERTLSDTVAAVDDAVGAIRTTITQPLRSGSGLMRVLHAAWMLFRSSKATKVREDEDAMFVG